MKKAIAVILLFVILLSAVGCVDHEKASSVGESNPIFGETEEAPNSSGDPVEDDPEEAGQTNASSNQPATDTVTENESTSTGVSQGNTDTIDTTQPTNGTETNPSEQTNSTTVTEPSSPSDTQTTPSEIPPFVTGDDGVDLPINPF